MSNPKNIFILPGTFNETSRRDGVGLNLRSVIRDELRSNGYPTNSCLDVTCSQPNLCDLLTGCDLGGGSLGAFNGVEGTGVEGDLFRLGGILGQDTEIDTDVHDFEILKGNSKLQFLQSALPLGAGESIRLYGVSGAVTAESGIYETGGGLPSIASRTYNSGSDVYTWLKHDTSLGSLTIRSGLAVESGYFNVTMDDNEIVIGRSDTSSVLLKITRKAYNGGSFVFSIEGLSEYIDDADAVSNGLGPDDLYIVDAGAAYVVGIVK